MPCWNVSWLGRLQYVLFDAVLDRWLNHVYKLRIKLPANYQP